MDEKIFYQVSFCPNGSVVGQVKTEAVKPEKLPSMKAALAAYRKAHKELTSAKDKRDKASRAMPELQRAVSAADSKAAKAGDLLLKVVASK